ncbi:VTC domain-containing protein [Stigmatella erecta]|uniref:VTC domain-containing protein n=1 Tax=Stigmatella erecta TaxID=83460 RepID=UPI001FE8D34A|nr:VTC domain-containing protein [Stigmatella erecta]
MFIESREDVVQPSPELDHERRFLPSPEGVASFVEAVRPWTEPLVYDPEQPHAFTRTTYFDTERLDFLASCGTKRPQRLRLREYAGSPHLAQPPVLTGPRFLEVKMTTGARRTKTRCPVSEEAANALLSGLAQPLALLPPELPGRAFGPMRPQVTAWYRRSTRATADGGVRLTLDEELSFALPPGHSETGGPALPTRLIERLPAPLLEVKWRGPPPRWLAQALTRLVPFESRGSKFEQGMRALLGSTVTPLPRLPR